MKFGLGPFRVELRRNPRRIERERAAFSIDDVDALNESTLSYLRQLPEAALDQRVRAVSVSDLDTEAGTTAAVERLRTDGIVVVPGFMESALAAELGDQIAELSEKLSARLGGQDWHQEEGVLVQRGQSRLTGYQKLASHDRPVMDVRAGRDTGMIDIFNVDGLLGPVGKEARRPFEHPALLSLLAQYGKKVSPRNLNGYVNRGVLATRGFHVDAYWHQLKAFIYLTDVKRLDDGPYTYVRASHVDGPYRRANQLLSADLPARTEAPLVPHESVIPVLGNKGSLVISDQSGFHRGFPQEIDACRIAAVMNFA